jgi:DNA-directed RNA polymerase specialized sigma24 family protein
MTLGEWLRLLDTDASAAGATLLGVATALAAFAGHRRASAEDTAQEASRIALEDGAAAIRRARPATPLGAWVRGVVRNLVRESRRAARPASLGEAVALVPANAVSPATEPEDAGPRAVAGAPATPRQADALALLRDGRTVAEVARALGIAYASARGLLLRGLRRERGLDGGTGDGDRGWVEVLLRSPAAPSLDDGVRALLEGHAAGATRADLALRLGISTEAVRCRLRRWRRKQRGVGTAWPPPPANGGHMEGAGRCGSRDELRWFVGDVVH